MKPAIGRIVHFVHEDFHHAAMITYLNENGTVNLIVFATGRAETSSFFTNNVALCTGVKQDETRTGEFTWHAPERVDPI